MPFTISSARLCLWMACTPVVLIAQPAVAGTATLTVGAPKVAKDATAPCN